MKRVYVAGKLTDTTQNYLGHVHRMIMCAQKIIDAGFAVYVPGWDLLQALVIGEISRECVFNNSQPWLDVSDAVFLTPGWETSEGTKKEIERAKTQGIPVFEDINELVKQLGDMR